MAKRSTVRVDAYRGEHRRHGTLPEFLAWVEQVVAAVPEQHRAEAQVEIACLPFYDPITAEIEVYYCRPETDEEMAARRLESLSSAQHDAFAWLVHHGGAHHGADRTMTRKLVSLRRIGLAESEPTEPTNWMLSDEGIALRDRLAAAAS